MIKATLRLAVGVILLCALTVGAVQAREETSPASESEPVQEYMKVQGLVAAGDFDQARTLSLTQLARTDLPPEDEVLTLSVELQRMELSGDWADLDALAPRVYAAAELPTALGQRVQMLHRLGATYSRSARFDETLKALDAAIALAGDVELPELQRVLRSKGGILAQAGRHPEAIEALHRAEKMNTALGLPDDYNTLLNLGGLYIQREDWPRAIDYLTRAESAMRSAPTEPAPPARLGVISVLAAAHIGAGNSQQAHRWSNIGLEFAREHGLPTTALLNNLATLLRDEGRFEEALVRLEEVKAQLSPSDRPELRGVMEKNIGETLIAMGQRQRADGHLQAARKLYETADVRANRLELYPVLIDNLEALGRPADALAAMREYKTLSDENNTADSLARIGELESQIDLERKTQELQKAEADGDLQRAENQALIAEGERSRTVNLAFAGLLVTLLLVLGLSLRHQRARNRSLRELAIRNGEIESQRSALEALNAVIHQQNLEDALTGLGNRRRFNEVMASQAASGTLPPALLVMADLDHFKQINDQYGHAVGDLALKHFAEALRAVARGQDLLVRWGGEEFAWLCPDATPAQGGALCERLMKQLRDYPLRVNGTTLVVSVSLGFAPLPVWPGKAADWQTTLRIADHAVYGAKDAGRDAWRGYKGGDVPAQSSEALTVDDMEARGYLVRLGASHAAEATTG